MTPGTLSATGAFLGNTPPPESRMFLFFSNRLGCLGSIAVSLLLTFLLLAFFGLV